MKVAIVAPSPVPFLVGGAEKLFWGLCNAINHLTPHHAELIKIPCKDREFWPLIEGYRNFSQLDLNYFDLVISTKYPAWMLAHHNHIVYMQHTCRGVYDLYHLSGQPLHLPPSLTGRRELHSLLQLLEQEPHRDLLDHFFAELFRLREMNLPAEIFSFPGPLTRSIIHWLDRVGLNSNEISRYLAISRNVALREDYFPAMVDIEVLHHPSDLTGFKNTEYSCVFTASRMENLKRVHLLIEAYKKVKTDIPFLIAGTGGQLEEYKKIAGTDSRIRFLGFVQDLELLNLYAKALFVPFIPFDEDYGLITVEAMKSAKAVLTASDSGGPRELVEDGINGLVVEAEADELAGAMETLLNDQARTINMGKKGKETVREINWENTVATLLGENKGSKHRIRTRKVVVVSTFCSYPPLTGGQRRLYYFCRELAKAANVRLLALGPECRETEYSPRFTEIVVAKSEIHLEKDKKLEKMLGISAGDLSAIDNFHHTPEFTSLLKKEVESADVVVLSHPYLYFAVKEVFYGRLWYDAHNVEYILKQGMLSNIQDAQEILDRVKVVEQACAQAAERIFSVSKEEMEGLRKLYDLNPEKFILAPNGMDLKLVRSLVLPPDQRDRLRERLGLKNPACIFVGTNHAPNLEAVVAVRSIAKELPDITFWVVGSVCETPVFDSAPHNMIPLGTLSEAEKATVLNAAHMALNPVTSGAGSNLKLIEYLAFGLPVLTTPHGLRGFSFQPDQHLIVADIQEFATKLKEYLPARLSELQLMVENAQREVEEYDWGKIFSGIGELI